MDWMSGLEFRMRLSDCNPFTPAAAGASGGINHRNLTQQGYFSVKMNLNPLAVTLTSALIALVSFDASAVTVSRQSTANAVGRCQGALPNYEGAIRKRPLALQNEGSTSAFVTCAFLSDQSNTAVNSFGVYARTTNGLAATLNCTAVVGYDTGTVEYSARSVELSAGGAQNSIYWDADDFPVAGAVDTDLPVTISCALPAGVGLNDMYFNYVEDIGS
jgi:hypothetical protein